MDAKTLQRSDAAQRWAFFGILQEYWKSGIQPGVEITIFLGGFIFPARSAFSQFGCKGVCSLLELPPYPTGPQSAGTDAAKVPISKAIQLAGQ